MNQAKPAPLPPQTDSHERAASTSPPLTPETQTAASNHPAGEAEIPDSPAAFLQSLQKMFRHPENISLLAAAFFACGTIWIGIELLEKVESFRRFLTEHLRSGFEPEIPAGTEVRVWLPALTFVLLVLPLALGFYSIAVLLSSRTLRKGRDRLEADKRRLEREKAGIASERDQLKGANLQLKEEAESLRKMLEDERQRVQTTLESRNDKLRRTLGGTIRAASRIRNQLFPVVAHGAGKTIESVHYIYYINKDFDTEVQRRYVLRAGETPLHFWQSSISVSSEAAPVETFVDIGYRLISHDSGKDVVYLPTRDELFTKSACIYFLPLIGPGERRDIEVAYLWPKMLLQLKKQGWEDFSVRLNNAGQLLSYQLEIYLEPGTGGMLMCSESGTMLPNKNLEPAISHHGWPGWKYSASHIDPDLLNQEIALRVEWRTS